TYFRKDAAIIQRTGSRWKESPFAFRPHFLIFCQKTTGILRYPMVFCFFSYSFARNLARNSFVLAFFSKQSRETHNVTALPIIS
ncbi:MAG: hypothetical protein ACI4CZ_06940, partial [Hominisplanchenecus sp.]